MRALNKYVDTSAPWTLFKEGKTDELGTVIYTLLECQRKIALHLLPVMPGTAARMLEQLGQKSAGPHDLRAEVDSFGTLAPGSTLAASSNLFPRAEVPETTAKPLKKAKTTAKEPDNAATKDASGLIEFADFQKLDLRVGTILEAKKHPEADKLLCLKVDLGEGAPRDIVSGLAEVYAPQNLICRQAVVVANLLPRKLRGALSQGMLLTAGEEQDTTLLAPLATLPPGSKIS